MSPSKIFATAAAAVALALTPVAANAADASAARPAGAAHHPVAEHHHKRLPVLMVRPGQRVDLGHGGWMTLTHTQRCVGYGSGSSCKNIMDGNQPPGTVSLQTFGDQARTLYSPLYIGPEYPARMTVQVGGAIYEARVVTLKDRPGYATGYAWGAPAGLPSGGPASWPKVTVYDASGKVIAAN